MAKKTKKQIGVLPVRHHQRGQTQVLLVTTRGKNPRWIIPKGGRSKRLRNGLRPEKPSKKAG
jgi:hypothetical protein